MPQEDKIVPLPFPNRTLSTRKPKSDEELLRMFQKIPKYTKFHKELCVHKRKKMKGGVEVGGIVSALTRNKDFPAGAQQELPKNCRDPRIFSVPCTIGDCILKDVLVQVNELIFPTDFYVLDLEDETSGTGYTLILGRPFLMIAKTKIDVHVGTLSMEFGDTLVQFNILEAMKHPTEDHSLFCIVLIDELVEEYLKATNDNSSSLPPPMEMKPLPSHLKYAYLDTEQQLLVIIAKNLHQEQEDKLLHVLRRHKKAIGWKLSKLLGINPSICMHRILMEEEAKPRRQQQ
ncbi:hypothetical protein CR513_12889, partial [Mucuna pruriens]